MMNRIVLLAAVAALLLAGCDQKPTDTSKNVSEARENAGQDVNKAQQDASKVENRANEKVADAQHDYAKTDTTARAKLTKAESDAMISKAQADFDVALAAADGRHNIAIEKCGAFQDVDKKACLSTADATFAADQAAVTATRDAALVRAAHHD